MTITSIPFGVGTESFQGSCYFWRERY